MFEYEFEIFNLTGRAALLLTVAVLLTVFVAGVLVGAWISH